MSRDHVNISMSMYPHPKFLQRAINAMARRATAEMMAAEAKTFGNHDLAEFWRGVADFWKRRHRYNMNKATIA